MDELYEIHKQLITTLNNCHSEFDEKKEKIVNVRLPLKFSGSSKGEIPRKRITRAKELLQFLREKPSYSPRKPHSSLQK